MLAQLLIWLFLAVAASPAAAQLRVESADSDQVVSIEHDSEEIANGVRKARATLEAFFAQAQNPRAGTDSFSVKIGLPTSRGKEYVWASLLRRENGRVSGKIDNTPRWTTEFRRGQIIDFSETEIIDWVYIDGDRMKGNFTSCAINKMTSTAEARAMQERFRMTCSD